MARINAPRCVVIDPIDGTWNFAHGLGTFGTILAVVEHGQTVWGALYDPLGDDRIEAHLGGGAWLIKGLLATERSKIDGIRIDNQKVLLEGKGLMDTICNEMKAVVIQYNEEQAAHLHTKEEYNASLESIAALNKQDAEIHNQVPLYHVLAIMLGYACMSRSNI